MQLIQRARFPSSDEGETLVESTTSSSAASPPIIRSSLSSNKTRGLAIIALCALSLLLLLILLLAGPSTTILRKDNLASPFISSSVGSSNVNDDPIQVLMTTCGSSTNLRYYNEAVDLLVTIQRYGFGMDDDGRRSSLIIVHLFTDNVKIMKTLLLDQDEKAAESGLDIRIYKLHEPSRWPWSSSSFNLFRKCASARLYAPYMFGKAGYDLVKTHNTTATATTTAAMSGDKDTKTRTKLPERILYLDSDTLVTTSLRKLWDDATVEFQKNPHALFAMTKENYHNNLTCDKSSGARFDLSETVCYNSGVLFAHLQRWIDFDFTTMVHEQVEFASTNLFEMPYGDQGILNAMSARFPDRLVELECEWNLRVDLLPECINTYRKNGGGILHGNRGLFVGGLAVGDGSASAELLHDYLTGVNRKPAKAEIEEFYAKELYDLLLERDS